jgi:virginiamycin B lyase
MNRLFAVGVLVTLTGVAVTARAADQHWLSSKDRHLTTDGQVQSYPLPHAGSAPTTLAIARDGRVWFTESAGNRIGRMHADGSDLVEFPLAHPNSSPRIIALGSDGNMWFSEHTGNRIGRITPTGTITEFEIPTAASQPRAISLGADGNIWFGMFAGGKIGRITPKGVITEFTPATADSGPRALATGPDGNVWFSEYKTNKIGRITPAGKITEFPMPRPNSGPGDITAGADGAMWFVELSGGMDGLTTDGNRVGRISMSGAVSEYAMPNGSASPINLAVGPDRNVWYTRGGSLGKVTPDGLITEFSTGEKARTVGITAGSDRQPPTRLVNRLWFTDAAGDRVAYLSFAATPAEP